MSLNIVEEIFRRHSDEKIAVIDADRDYSFAELKTEVERLAGSLPDLKSQRIGLFIPNGIAHILWSLAVLKRGGVLVPVPTELTEVERTSLVRTTALHYVLSLSSSTWTAGASETEEIADSRGSQAILAKVAWSAPQEWQEKDLNDLNPALIRFSSGTTGKAKGVILSHQTLLDRVTICNQKLGIGVGDRIIWTLPMAHHFAVSIVLYLIHGATTVLENSHMGESLYKALEKHQGTVLYGAPFHFALLSAYESAVAVPSLRLAVSTASALSKETAVAFQQRFGIPLTQGMGIIEIGLPILNSENAEDCPEAIGRPQPGFEVELRDSSGQKVAEGEVGQLYVRGPGMFDAYLYPWQPKVSLLDDVGFFSTGDLAKLDEKGNLYLVGRTKSVINVGGMKCFPEEIEAVLSNHPEVREVRVSSSPHPTFGSVPSAEIVLRDPQQPPKMASLMTFCRSQLASYKIPVKYLYVEEIPKTASGKIQRH